FEVFIATKDVAGLEPSSIAHAIMKRMLWLPTGLLVSNVRLRSLQSDRRLRDRRLRDRRLVALADQPILGILLVSVAKEEVLELLRRGVAVASVALVDCQQLFRRCTGEQLQIAVVWRTRRTSQRMGCDATLKFVHH